MKLLNFINNKYFKYFLFLNLIEFLDLIITNIKKIFYLMKDIIIFLK